jgi:hypothetical protein
VIAEIILPVGQNQFCTWDAQAGKFPWLRILCGRMPLSGMNRLTKRAPTEYSVS